MVQSRSKHIFLSALIQTVWVFLKAKVEQIPIEIEALRCEQNKLLQQLKQNTIEPSAAIDNSELKKQIDDLSRKIDHFQEDFLHAFSVFERKNVNKKNNK